MPGKGFIRDSVHKKKMLLENSFFVGALIFWYKSFFMIKMTKVWKFLPSRFSPGMISVSLKYEYENFEKCESFLLKMFTRDDFCIFKVWRWKFEKVWNFSLKMFTREVFRIFSAWRWKIGKVWKFSFQDVYQGSGCTFKLLHAHHTLGFAQED